MISFNPLINSLTLRVCMKKFLLANTGSRLTRIYKTQLHANYLCTLHPYALALYEVAGTLMNLMLTRFTNPGKECYAYPKKLKFCSSLVTAAPFSGTWSRHDWIVWSCPTDKYYSAICDKLFGYDLTPTCLFGGFYRSRPHGPVAAFINACPAIPDARVIDIHIRAADSLELGW